MECESFAIMKAASLDTPVGINTMLPALRTPGIRTEDLGHSSSVVTIVPVLPFP